VNISAKTEYACIAVLELAAQYGSGQPVRIGMIADKHGVPSRFLVQILLQLKGAGLVGSTRGASGGYQLIRDPAEITLGEVMAVIEGQSYEVTSNATRETSTSRVLLESWNEVATLQNEMLSATTFADLVNRAKDDLANMYYI
jgi:Rrf2 family protein